jgi:hypothetical protein
MIGSSTISPSGLNLVIYGGTAANPGWLSTRFTMTGVTSVRR